MCAAFEVFSRADYGDCLGFGYHVITDSSACESAAAIVGRKYVGSVASKDYPAGCYWHAISDGVYLNTHPPPQFGHSEQGLYFVRMFCAGTPIPAPGTHNRFIIGPFRASSHVAVHTSRTFVRATGRPSRDGAHVQPSGRYGPLAQRRSPSAAAAGRRRGGGSGLARGGTVRPQSACCVCAAFALGVAGSNACPPSYSRIGTEDMCKSAAAIAGNRFGGSVASSYYPSGCYWHTISGRVYLNPDVGGAGNYYTQPFCVGPPTSAGYTPQRTMHSMRRACAPRLLEILCVCSMCCTFRACDWQAQPRRRPRSALRTVRAARPVRLRRGGGAGAGAGWRAGTARRPELPGIIGTVHAYVHTGQVLVLQEHA